MSEKEKLRAEIDTIVRAITVEKAGTAVFVDMFSLKSAVDEMEELIQRQVTSYEKRLVSHLNQWASVCPCDGCVEVIKQFKRVNKLGDWSDE